MAADDVGAVTAARPAVGAAAEPRKLRQVLGRLGTVLFLTAYHLVDRIRQPQLQPRKARGG